jgi:hypothetical protein
MRRLLVVPFLSLGFFSCEEPEPEPQPNPNPPLLPVQACPGEAGCEAVDAPGALLAGAAKRDVTPYGFEVARLTYLDNNRPERCDPNLYQGVPVCGELKDSRLDDCGNDALCFGDEGYEGADADGSEGDGITDFFLDCGRDRICPPPFDTPEEGELATNGLDDDGDGAVDEGAWVAADEGEGDGVFQGLWVAGYGNNRPAMGVKDPLWARTIVLQQDDVTVAMVTVDAVGLFYDIVEDVRERLEAARPGAVDLVVIQSTHTHEAPDTLGQWGHEDPYAGLQLGHGRNDRHMELITQGSVDSILEAVDNLVPARVLVGKTNTAVDGFLRDSRDPKIFEDTLTSIRVVDESDATIATLVNWGNHPESLDSRNNYISSDYPHTTRLAIEEGLPATDAHPARAGLGGIAIYQQGLVGGLMGPNGFPITGRDGTVYENEIKSFARTDAFGDNLAEQAFIAMESEVEVTGQLRFSRLPYRAPVENRVFQVGFHNGWFDRGLFDFDIDAAFNDENVPHLQTEVALIYFGEIGWLTGPGEIFPELWVGFDPAQSFGRDTIDPNNPNPPNLDDAPEGPYLKEIVGVEYPILLGLAQDETGYFVPPYNFKLDEVAPYIEEAEGDHYEETNSIGPSAVPLFLEHAGALLDFESKRAP